MKKRGMEDFLNDKKTDERFKRISFLGIPEKWGERALNVFCIFAFIYICLSFYFKDSSWLITLEGIIGKGASFVTFSFGAIVIVIHLWDKIMFNYKRLQEAERRVEAAEKQVAAVKARLAESETERAALEARIAALEAEKQGSPTSEK